MSSTDQSTIMTYSGLKSLILAKNLLWQYFEYTDRYVPYSRDGAERFESVIYKAGFEPEGIDPVAEAANLTNFETNYKPTANKRLGFKISGYDGENVAQVNSDKEVLVHDTDVVTAIGSLTVTGTSADIVCSGEFAFTAKVETDVPGVTYTVTSGKVFYLVAFSVASDSPSPMTYRLKVDNVVKKVIKLGTPGGETNQLIYPVPAKLAVAGQVIKITYDANFNRGNGWCEFIGLER